MANEVDICNMALSFLGDRATVTSISPPEGSAQAEHCARFYPMAVKEMLSQARWSFATKRASLVEYASKPAGALHAYAIPADCLKMQEVHGTRFRSILKNWTVERHGSSMALITDDEVEYVRYTSSDAPASVFPGLFALALAHLLASKIAGAMVTGPTGVELAQAQLKYYDLYLRRAVTEDASNCNEDIEIGESFMGDYCGEERFYGEL